MLHVKKQVFHSDLKIPTIRSQAIFTASCFSHYFPLPPKKAGEILPEFLHFCICTIPLSILYPVINPILQETSPNLPHLIDLPCTELDPYFKPLLLTSLVEESLVFLSHAPCSSGRGVCGLPTPVLPMQHLP